ncbi:hypothetical protein CS063_11505 [Sporanaerobium hydrogeniformans]|uniref:Uncharacterized protein n=1 Tax=Sporanaerobium hydrogeniformans TaxID=3072179 RepID=A0AC61DBY5_9FIRM|nr:BMC domain-containing protein [Sporanaerobium hydrogeniformans]PHV70288.1 hypothetical protein CS063_11505 [Sporanaerobium hydrogeniformans]
MRLQALGLIEVIGYPAAIEAADAALKASNVQLSGLSKVGSGIMTVQLFGDVGAIRAAVDAGSSAAERIGTVRSAHIIPRLDEAIIGTIVKPPLAHKKSNEEETFDNEKGAPLTEPEHSDEMGINLEKKEALQEEIINFEELDKKSNEELRGLIQTLGISVSSKKLKTAKKEELLELIKSFNNKATL